jgi:Peptidase A4 family
MSRGFVRGALAAMSMVGAPGLVCVATASAAPTGSRISVRPLVQLGRPGVRPLSSLGRVGSTMVVSSNWSGYAATGQRFSDVKGSWVQPSVSCTSRRAQYASFWLGLDGYSSDTVEQIGADSDCQGRNRSSYYAWYEMYPSGSVEVPLSVEPGDSLSAQVAVSGSTYTLTISDSRSGIYATRQTLTGAANSSAEWIAESPEICSFTCTLASLADFGTLTFSNAAAATSGSRTEPIGAFPNSEEIVMETSNGTVRAQPSSLSVGGSVFSDTWKHS